MSTAINIYHPTISALHGAIQREFSCSLAKIVSFPDTLEKKIAVFILKHFQGYDSKDIGLAYCITWLYVPTVVNQMMDRYSREPIFRERLMRILNELENAEETESA